MSGFSRTERALQCAKQQQDKARRRARSHQPYAPDLPGQEAKTRAQAIAAPVAPTLAAAPAVPTKMSPAELVAKLFALKSAPVNQTRAGRQVIYWLEELIAAGPPALPAIREFLSHNQDLEFGLVAQGKGVRVGAAFAAVIHASRARVATAKNMLFFRRSWTS